MSAEPSMEDILASIKRVIKEGEPPAPRRAAPRPLPMGNELPADEVLDLSDPLARAEPQSAAPTPAAVRRESPAPTLSAVEAAQVSAATVEATRGALASLSRLVVKPEPDSDGTLEGLVRDMLRPMLSDWLDTNLPRLVEQMVAREIEKITAAQG